jgi:hypothetical protein
MLHYESWIEGGMIGGFRSFGLAALATAFAPLAPLTRLATPSRTSCFIQISGEECGILSGHLLVMPSRIILGVYVSKVSTSLPWDQN